MNPHFRFETKVLTAFTAAALVVAMLAAATWKISRDAVEAALWVAHTHEVLNKLVHIRGNAFQIELSTQNYRLSGDAARLAERDAVIAERETALRRIKELTADNASQQARWARLRQVVDERIAISRRTEQLRKTQGQEAAAAYVASVPLRATRERMYDLILEMEQEENRLLAQRSAEQLRMRQITIVTGALAALGLLALLTVTYMLIRRQLRKIETSRRALAESEQNLSTTLHSIGDAMLATDANGRITRMNPVAEQLTGWPLNEALGRPAGDVFRIIHEQTRAPAPSPLLKVLATGRVQGLANHTLLIARDGREWPIGDSAAPIRNAAGQVSGVVLVFRDMSAERRAEQTIREQNEILEQRVHERTEQLRASEAHLRNVIDNVPVLIAYVDAQQRYVYTNRDYLKRFAPGETGISGRTVRETLGEERYAIAAPRIGEVLQGQPQSYDWQPFPDVWQLVNYVPRHDAQNKVAGYYVLISDITARKRMEIALKASEERLRLLIDGAKDYAIIMLDAQGRVLTWNAGAQRLKGYTEKEIAGQPMERFYPPEDIAAGKPARLLARAVAEGRCEDEGWRVRKDGTRFYADVVLSAIRNPSGELAGYAKVTRDISERKKLEVAAAVSRAKLDGALANMTDAVCISDADGNFIEINEACAGFYRFQHKDECPRSHCAYPDFIEALLPGGELAAPEMWAVPRALRGETATNAEYSLRRKDTGETWVGSFSFSPIHDKNGAIIGSVVAARDITERKRAEQDIQKLNTELAQRLHELERVSRALRTLSAGNHTLLHATGEQSLLDSMCQVIVDAGGYRMAMVFYRNDDRASTLRPMAETGYPGGLAALQALELCWGDDEHGHGALGAAIRSGQTNVVRNMLTDPDYAPWRPHLHGNASGVACPLRVNGEIIGALTIYAAEPDAFDPDEVELLTESADDLAFGIATLRARTEQEKTRAAMQHLARFDALTGLPNETQFTESLTAAIDAGERLNQSFALLQINIERLREINDALGFSHGDELLREFGTRLNSAAPEPAVVARLRGDEFALMLPGSNANAAIAMAKRLTEVLAQPFLIADIPLDVQSKIGIALFPGHGSTPHDLFRRMDMALQQAEKKGGGMPSLTLSSTPTSRTAWPWPGNCGARSRAAIYCSTCNQR